ncbi:hypothetical protein CPB97_000354 [Podila verticillata]|nr:hypothetical protein CPB97_000354 [Podila verticillata]
MAFRHHDQHFNNKDTFENGATATLIVIPQMPTVEMLEDHTSQLNAEDLHPTKEENKHLQDVLRYHLAEVLVQRVKDFKSNPIPVPVKGQLPPAKTEMYPLPCMHIDQVTVEGNRDILDEIMAKATQLNPEWFEKKQTILRMHYGKEGKKTTPGSLGHILQVLERKRIGLDKLNFHDLDQFLCQVFDAMALLLWENEFESGDLYKTLTTSGFDRQGEIKEKTKHILDKFLFSRSHSHISNQQSKNAALFIRDMLFYLELGSAIKAGDIGRIGENIRWVTLLFQAGSTQNYANELLCLHCQVFYSSDSGSKDIIMASMVVNTAGQPNRFIPCDLLQEHHNLLTKSVYNAKGSNLTWEYLKEKISTNIRIFQSITTRFQEEFKILTQEPTTLLPQQQLMSTRSKSCVFMQAFSDMALNLCRLMYRQSKIFCKQVALD